MSSAPHSLSCFLEANRTEIIIDIIAVLVMCTILTQLAQVGIHV